MCLTGRMMGAEEAEPPGLNLARSRPSTARGSLEDSAETIASMSLAVAMLVKESVNRFPYELDAIGWACASSGGCFLSPLRHRRQKEGHAGLRGEAGRPSSENK